MRIRTLTLSILTLFAFAHGAFAGETLKVAITTPDGEQFQSLRELATTLENDDSEALVGMGNTRQYSAIRCDSAWGAVKYRVDLASGPGFRLTADDTQLRLQLLQYSVVSEDVNIAAMQVHCFDSAPKTVVHALGEITLERGRTQSQRFQLPSGYAVELHYEPSNREPGDSDPSRLEIGTNGTGGAMQTQEHTREQAAQQADAGSTEIEEG
ncbi:hypothetical protein Maes01_00730 [Microbulbifer aestuariivivens]|uniref:Uncharacterized protein n=1 Tax=Microbulbifer aestuariivivens TaxID=1908308 RepID=A0ABP9WLU8_9GAMM